MHTLYKHFDPIDHIDILRICDMSRASFAHVWKSSEMFDSACVQDHGGTLRSHKETRVFLNYSGTGRVQKSFTLSERLVARPQRLTLIFTGVGVLEGHSWNGSCGLQFSLIHSIRSFPSALHAASTYFPSFSAC